MRRGGAFVVLDVEEACIALFALQDYRRNLESAHRAPEVREQFRDLADRTAALIDRITTRMERVKAGAK